MFDDDAGAVIGIALILFVVGVVYNLCKGDTKDEDDAIKKCQVEVLPKLRAPGSAKFGGASAKEQGKQRWTAKGWVDSHNVYGALLRSRWTCRVAYEGSDKWDVVVTLHEREQSVPVKPKGPKSPRGVRRKIIDTVD